MQIEIRGDKILWTIALTLGVIGLLVVYSASVGLVFRHHPDMPEYYLVKQGLTLVLALFLAYAIHFTDYRKWGPLFEWFWIGSVVLLAYAFFRGSGAQRWLYIGGVSLQPSELGRFSLMGLLAYRVALHPESTRTWQGLMPLLVRIGITFALIAPLNLSNGLLLLGMSAIFLYIGGMSVMKFFRLGLIGMVGVVVLFLTAPRARVWQQRLASYWKKSRCALSQLMIISGRMLP